MLDDTNIVCMCEMLGMETQGLVHGKQMCYGLSHTPSPSLMDSKQVLYKYAIPSPSFPLLLFFSSCLFPSSSFFF